jgi:hypothetical protein
MGFEERTPEGFEERCPDYVQNLLRGDYCLSALSKDLKGTSSAPEADRHDCHEPGCSVLVTRQKLELKVTRHKECDAKLSQLLDGTMEIAIGHAFDSDTKHRGMHGGRFTWQTKAGVVSGELAGVSNAGLHRPPAGDCEKCFALRVDEGRFCGEFTELVDKDLEGTHLVGLYRLKYTRVSGRGFAGDVAGVLEGNIVLPCRD